MVRTIGQYDNATVRVGIWTSVFNRRLSVGLDIVVGMLQRYFQVFTNFSNKCASKDSWNVLCRCHFGKISSLNSYLHLFPDYNFIPTLSTQKISQIASHRHQKIPTKYFYDSLNKNLSKLFIKFN